jgi:hypothetical protein
MSQHGCQPPATVNYFQVVGSSKEHSGILYLFWSLLPTGDTLAYNIWTECVTWPIVNKEFWEMWSSFQRAHVQIRVRSIAKQRRSMGEAGHLCPGAPSDRWPRGLVGQHTWPSSQSVCATGLSHACLSVLESRPVLWKVLFPWNSGASRSLASDLPGHLEAWRAQKRKVRTQGQRGI